MKKLFCTALFGLLLSSAFAQTPAIAEPDFIGEVVTILPDGSSSKLEKETVLLRTRANASAQIFGSDPVCMAEAACIAAEISGADLIDINMGCPVGKIVSNGDGSALMRDPEKAARIAQAVVEASPVPVTVKMRRGWDKGIFYEKTV